MLLFSLADNLLVKMAQARGLGFVLPCTWPPFALCYLATLQLGSDNNSKVSKKKKNNLKRWTWLIVLKFSFASFRLECLSRFRNASYLFSLSIRIYRQMRPLRVSFTYYLTSYIAGTTSWSLANTTIHCVRLWTHQAQDFVCSFYTSVYGIV